MFTLDVTTEQPQALQATINALVSLSPADWLDGLGRESANLTREHLFKIAGERHRSGSAHNFYADAADATTHEVASDSLTVRISKVGIAQRFFGGTIAAFNAKHLWIPVDPESQGRTPGDFDDLIAIVNTLTNKGVGLRTSDQKVLFALVDNVTQSPDDSILPSSDDYAERVSKAIDQYLSVLSKQ